MGFGSPPLHSLWFCDLLWTNKHSRSKVVPLPNLHLKDSICFCLCTGPLASTTWTNPRLTTKKTKQKTDGTSQMSPRYGGTAQPGPVKLTHNWPQTQEQAQWTLKELTSGAQLKVLTHGQDTKKWCLFQPLTSGMIYYSAIANCYKQTRNIRDVVTYLQSKSGRKSKSIPHSIIKWSS